MDAFYDPDIENINEAMEAVDHYEWAITDNSENSRLVTKWTTAENIQITANKVVYNSLLIEVLSLNLHLHLWSKLKL